MADDVLITEEGRCYFTLLPNLVDDMDLDPYAFRLYAHLKRVAGENGRCWQSQRTLAEACGFSPPRIVEAKRELERHGLIRVNERKFQGGRYHEIIIVDIWPQNMAAFHDLGGGHQVVNPGHQVVNPGHQVVNPGHQVVNPGHQVDRKKNPLKKNQGKKNPRKSESPSGDSPPSEPRPDQAMFEALAEVCCIDWKVAPRGGGRGTGALNKTGKALRQAEIAPADVRTFGKWWTANDWRGQRGDPPTPAQVRSEWKRYKEGRRSKRASPTQSKDARSLDVVRQFVEGGG